MMPDLFSVAGRIACVTGASSGLGRMAALLLARSGAKVVAIARRQDALSALRDEAEGDVYPLAADLSAAMDWAHLAGQIAQPFGRPDILVNAAGINLRQQADAVTRDGWDKTIHLNLTAPFFLAQALVDGMKQSGRGRIVNFASLQSQRAFAGGMAYGASKGGVAQLTRAMAEAWSSHGVNANALAPGFFPTELTGPVFADEAVRSHHARQTCVGRNGEMADLHGPLLFLCSNASAYVTGQILYVDGGYTAK